MLTDTKLRSLKPREDAYRVADTNGLCIEVRPSGAKVWRYRYRHAGKASMITLAEYPRSATHCRRRGQSAGEGSLSHSPTVGAGLRRPPGVRGGAWSEPREVRLF
ncbi:MULTISPECIES: Arm DNA-binding domain-containing protein [unclassified Stenotrophomonas]|uniref:Arm DNA-binding domain-containing protein n=1 Tax=unclassified Stenotrophomonas TaxID=196198 RepID=UPI0020A66998|nr:MULTISPECIES: Arm DNA-binding domain-containing protein [unclassified Stenotrophomonas]